MNYLNDNCIVLLVAVVAMLAGPFSPQGFAQSVGQVAQTDAGQGALIRSLRAIVGKSSQGVEIQLRGACASTDSELMSFSLAPLQEAGNSEDCAVSIKTALQANKQLSVVRVSPKVILVKDSAVPQDLLGTRINRLDLPRLAQYSPESTIAAAINSEAIQLRLHGLNMRQVVAETGLQHVNAGGQPHMARHLNNITLSEVLFSVLDTFGGFVVYSDCIDSRGVRRFDISYYK